MNTSSCIFGGKVHATPESPHKRSVIGGGKERVAIMAAPNATAQRPGRGQQQAKPRPFRIGVQSKDEIDFDVTVTGTTSVQDLPVLNVPPAGFLRGIYVLVDTITANTGTVSVQFTPDAPFNVLATIQLEDVNSQPIIGPFTGYDLYLVNKYGGYTFSNDPRARSSPAFFAVTGAGTTGASPTSAQGGAYTFVLRLPVELTNRDGIGSLPNKSGTSMFKVRTRINTTANVYATAPATSWVTRTRMEQVNWWDPPQVDLRGRALAQNPPAVQTTQYWTKSSFAVATSQTRVPLERVGFLIRNMIFILRDSNGSRTASGDANWPDPFTLQFESIQLIVRLKTVWIAMLGELYGYSASESVAAQTANARDLAVYVESFARDFALAPGAETRMGYLPTSPATRLEVQGTFGGSGTLDVLTNDVAPANGDDMALVGR